MPPTPFMGLTLPTVGITLGPEWATEVNAAFTQVDAHNHTTGQGVPIPTNGISVNADFPFNSFNATLLRSTQFQSQPSPLSLITDIACLYVSGGNLYYNNLLGQQVQITQGAGLDASSVGGFGGDYGTSTASAFYTSATSTFTFWQAPNQSALMDVGPLVLHNTSSITTGITLQAPNPLASSYTLTLPNSLPASTKILTVDNAGNIGDVYDVDNTTIQVSSNTLQVVPGGIGPTQLAPLNFAQSSSSTTSVITSNSFTTVLTVSITASGLRPVMLKLDNDTGGIPAYIGARLTTTSVNPITLSAQVRFLQDGGVLGSYRLQSIFGSLNNPETGFHSVPSSAFSQFAPTPTAGVHTYAVQVTSDGAGYQTEVFYTTLIAYEL